MSASPSPSTAFWEWWVIASIFKDWSSKHALFSLFNFMLSCASILVHLFRMRRRRFWKLWSGWTWYVEQQNKTHYSFMTDYVIKYSMNPTNSDKIICCLPLQCQSRNSLFPCRNCISEKLLQSFYFPIRYSHLRINFSQMPFFHAESLGYSNSQQRWSC